MPYKIYKKGTGYKACKKGGEKCFSKKPLTKEKATSQMKALYASENVSVKESIDKFPDDYDFEIQDNKVKFVLEKGATPDEDFSLTVTVRGENEDVLYHLQFVDPESAEGISQDSITMFGDVAKEKIMGSDEQSLPESKQFEFEALCSTLLVD